MGKTRYVLLFKTKFCKTIRYAHLRKIKGRIAFEIGIFRLEGIIQSKKFFVCDNLTVITCHQEIAEFFKTCHLSLNSLFSL